MTRPRGQGGVAWGVRKVCLVLPLCTMWWHWARHLLLVHTDAHCPYSDEGAHTRIQETRSNRAVTKRCYLKETCQVPLLVHHSRQNRCRHDGGVGTAMMLDRSPPGTASRPRTSVHPPQPGHFVSLYYIRKSELNKVVEWSVAWLAPLLAPLGEHSERRQKPQDVTDTAGNHLFEMNDSGVQQLWPSGVQ